MTRWLSAASIVAAIVSLSACSLDEITSFGAEAGVESKPRASTTPRIPKLGALVDRAGRPLTTTLLLGGLLPAGSESLSTAQEAYNLSEDPSRWVGVITEFESALSLIDALDASCGNQLVAGSEPVAGRYSTLAEVLADDRIYVDTSASKCEKYLSVEEKQILADRAAATAAAAAAAAAAAGTSSTATTTTVSTTLPDCGGRSIRLDSTDQTYSLLIGGRFSTVPDGVDINPESGASNDTFPFLAPAP